MTDLADALAARASRAATPTPARPGGGGYPGASPRGGSGGNSPRGGSGGNSPRGGSGRNSPRGGSGRNSPRGGSGRNRRPPGPRSVRGRSLRRTARILVGLLLLAGLLLGGLRAYAARHGLGGRLPGGSAAKVLRADGLETPGPAGWVSLREGDEIRSGARLRTGAKQARLRLRNGEVWLGPRAAARVFVNRADLIRGEVLVFSRGRLTAGWTDIEVSGKGTFRITPGTNPRLGIYEGQATVRRPGEQRTLSALEQLGLAGRRLPADPGPLVYRPEDPWDKELLRPAIVLDAEIARLARGIDLRFGRQARPAAFYRSLPALSALDPGVVEALAGERDGGRFGPPSDVLVALFVAQAASKSGAPPAALAPLLTQIAQQRAQGARWGVISLRLGIDVSGLERAVDQVRIGQLAAGPDRPSPSPPLAPAPGPSQTSGTERGAPGSPPDAVPDRGSGDPQPSGSRSLPVEPLSPAAAPLADDAGIGVEPERSEPDEPVPEGPAPSKAPPPGEGEIREALERFVDLLDGESGSALR